MPELWAGDRCLTVAANANLLDTLLAAGLENAPGLLRGGHDPLAFVNRQRERLLAIHVLAGAHRGDVQRTGETDPPEPRRVQRIGLGSIEDSVAVRVAGEHAPEP